MKTSNLLAFTMTALLAASSAHACPKDGQSGVGASADFERTYQVAEQKQAPEGERAEGERPQRKEGAAREGRGPGGERPDPFMGLDLTDDQKADIKEIMEASREEAMKVMEDAKAKHEAGEEVDREAVRKQMMEIREGAFKKVYDTVLTDEQRAKVDERRKQMEENRKKREAQGEGERKGGPEGERPRRPRPEEGKQGGGDLEL